MADATTALRRQQQQHLLLHTDANDDDEMDEAKDSHFVHPSFDIVRDADADADGNDESTRALYHHQQQPQLFPFPHSKIINRSKKSSAKSHFTASTLSSPKLYDFSLITPSAAAAVEDHRHQTIPSQSSVSQQTPLSLVSILDPNRTHPTLSSAAGISHSDVTLSPLQQPPSVSTTTTTTTTTTTATTTGASTSSSCSGSSSSPHPSRRAAPLQAQSLLVNDIIPPPPPSSTSFLSASFLRRQKRRTVMNKNIPSVDVSVQGMTSSSTAVTSNANDTALTNTYGDRIDDPSTRILTTAASSANEKMHSKTNTPTAISSHLPLPTNDNEKNIQMDTTDDAENDCSCNINTNDLPRHALVHFRSDCDIVPASFSPPLLQSIGSKPVETPHDDDHDDVTTLKNYLTMNSDTQLASQYFQNQQYDDALQAYERATQYYCQQLRSFLFERKSNWKLLQQLFPSCGIDDAWKSSDPQRSIRVLDVDIVMMVTAINAAACYRNMGAVARILHESPDIIDHYLHCAQYLYQLVQECVEQDVKTTGNDSETLSKNDKNEVICLSQMIVETLQSRAVNYVEFGSNISLAIACHQECIQEILLRAMPTSRTVSTSLADGIVLISLSKLKWMELMTYSLQYLGSLYRTVIPESIVTLQTFQESIHVVKGNIPWDEFETIFHGHRHNDDTGRLVLDENESTMKTYRHVIDTVIELLRTLSEIYTEYCSRQKDDDDKHNFAMDCAIDTLHDAMDMELQYNSACHVEPNAEALQAIDQMGLANEQLQQYDKALACYEKALLARSQYYGENHIDVAKSLINVARIMEVQGNVEGGLDLYRAAHAIYTYQITSTQPTIFANGDDASAILQLIPNLLENERYEEARAYLMKCLTIVEKEEQADGALNETKVMKSIVDKSQIYYDLGRACIGLKDNVSATIYLVESTKVENGKVTEEQVLTLLQHIDSIQHREERNVLPKNTILTSDDIQHQLLHKIYSLDESIRLSRSLDNQVNLTLSNLVSVPSNQSSKSIPTTSFRTLSPAASYKKRTTKDISGKLQPRSTTFSTASSRDLDFEQDERPESVLSGLTSLLQSESSQCSNNKNNSTTKESQLESDLSGMTSLFKDDSRSRNFNSRPTLSTNTLPTLDFISDVEPNFRAELFDPCRNSNSEKRQYQVSADLRGLTDEEITVQLIEHTHISTMSGSFSSPKRSVELKGGAKRSPSRHILCSSVLLSDELELRIPISFDTNGDRSNESSRNKLTAGRGLLPRSAPTTPRKSKDEKSTSSSQQQHKHMLSKVFGEKLRRRPRREGFQTLSDSPPAQRKIVPGNESELPTEEEVTEEGSAVTGHVPVFLVGGVMDDDDISEITMRHFNDLKSSNRDTNQEWWWGVTAEGFGRWFPTTYVTQAVQAADAFLSAKAIHAQSPKCLNQKCLSINSTSISTQFEIPLSPSKVDNSAGEDNSQSDCGSQDQLDIASNVGITSTKASRVNFLDYMNDKRGYQTGEGAQDSLRSQSFPLNLFTSPAPTQRHDYDNGKDIVSEILSCRELLVTQQKQFGLYDRTVANTLFKLAILYSRDRDVEAAIECANEALRIQVKMENIPDSAQSLHFLADLYLHQKEYKHALTHYNRALSYETKHFGYISDPVAKTLNCIGTVRLLQNDFRASMESHQQALCILQESHDNDENNNSKTGYPHPFVIEVLCHIGTVYYRERQQDCNSVVASTATTASSSRSSEKYMTHLDITMFERLGRAYEDRGLYSMAIYFLKEKSRYLESTKVEQTMDVLNESAVIYNRLGLLSCHVGSYDAAIQYFERGLSLQLQLGCTAVQVAISRVYIASVQYHLGQYHPALLSYHDALECYHNNDEIEDSDRETLQEYIALTLYYMGMVQAALCDYNTAMITLQDAHTIQQELFGIDHLYTLRTRREIGILNTLYIDDVPIALNYFQSIIAAQNRLHTVDRHPDIAETLHCTGLAYVRQKEYNKALRTLEDCYYMRLEFFGSDHPTQATTLYDIANVLLLLQRYSYHKVLQICDYVLHIRLVKLNEKHIDIARVYVMKGKCYIGIGHTDDAHRCFTDAYDMASQCLKNDDYTINNVNENHVLFAEIYTEWSTLYLMKCQFDVARSYIEKVMNIYRTNLQMDDDYDGIIAAQHILHRIEHDEMLCV